MIIFIFLDACGPLKPVFAKVKVDLSYVQLSLRIQTHSSSMPEIRSKLIGLTQSMTNKAVSDIVIYVDTVDHHEHIPIKKDTLRVEECFGHLVDLLEVKVINFRTVKQHLTNICNKEAEISNRLHHFRISTNPEAMQSVLQVFFEVSTVLLAMFGVLHSVVVKCASEEAP